MDLSESQYIRARKALAEGTAPEHLVGDLQSLVDQYDQAHQGEHSTTPALAEVHNRAPLADVAPPDLTRKVATAKSIGRPDPNATEDTSEEAVLHHEEQFPAHLRETSASGRADVYTPPEFMPPAQPEPPSGSPFDAVWGKIRAAQAAMPTELGGNVEHYKEPSFEQFRRAVAPTWGDVGPEYDFTGGRAGASKQVRDAYNQWKDFQWKEAHDKAVAEGKPIVRDEYSTPTGLGDRAARAAASVGKTAKSAAIGVDRALTGGLGGVAAFAEPHEPPGSGWEGAKKDWKRAVEARDYAAAGSPMADELGQAAGTFLPGSIANRAASGTKSLLGRLAPEMAEGFAGAAAGAAPSLVEDVVSGRDEGMGQRALLSGGIGMGIGTMAGAAHHGIEAEARNLRTAVPELVHAEEGGMERGLLGGVKPGPNNEALSARAAEEGTDVPHMIAKDLEGQVVGEALSRQAQNRAEAQKLRDFEDAHTNDRRPMRATIKAILDARKELVQSDGTVASVNQPEMTKLDKLLKDVLDVSPAEPEHMREPKHPELLSQLDQATDIHGELGTPESYAKDVKNLEQLNTPTRPVTPQAQASGPKAAPAETPDLGPFGEGLPPAEEQIRIGAAGERLRSLHEARAQNPGGDIFDVDSRTARRLNLPFGIDSETAHRLAVDQGLPPDIDPETARQLAIDTGLPESWFLRLSAKGKNPKDVRELAKGLRQRHESTSQTSKEPFPDYGAIKRAEHVDRDQFQGETEDIPRSLTHTLPSGEVLHGYSAKNAQVAEGIGKLESTLKLLGLKPGSLDEIAARSQAGEPSAEGVPFQEIAAGYGRPRSPDIDNALRDFAGAAGYGTDLEAVKQFQAMQKIKEMSRLGEVLRFSRPSLHMRGTAARLRLDPILQLLAPHLSGQMGGLGAIRRHEPLPPQEDQATLDEIERALGP